ncbi:WSC domain protein [Ostertagia ostertagi]
MGIERVLLQTMKFDLQVDLPYQYLIDYSKKFKLTKTEINSLVHTSWTFVNDSAFTTLCLIWEPQCHIFLFEGDRCCPSPPCDIANLSNSLIDDICHKLHPGATPPNTNWYSCNVTDPLAVSALARAKTESCIRKITDAACRLKNGAFHDQFPESQCGNHDSSLINMRVGCFKDHKNNRTLNGFSYEFKSDNSAEKCRSFCYRAGFVYYGLEFGRECFCGDSIPSKPISQERCSEYKCSGNTSQTCGGFNALEVFHTGLKRAHLMPKAIFETNSDIDSKRPRILFLLQLNGRNERQVKRLLKALYSPFHYYYIHVDKRQLYMLTEMKAVAAKLSNVFVAPDAHSTIWGGASLLTMVQDTIRRSIVTPSLSDWDYLINLSESDFPVMTLNEFETQLRANAGMSYMSSHGYNTGRFIQKQGFDFVFVECENRMWRIGKSCRTIPAFVKASLAVICDSQTWNRKQGCRCESLKRVVDWCGCSPLVFTKEHTHKFAVKNAVAKPFYFARKFESLVDIDAIALAEEQAMRDRSPPSYTNDVMFNVTFVNHYKADIDGYCMFFLEATTTFSLISHL